MLGVSIFLLIRRCQNLLEIIDLVVIKMKMNKAGIKIRI
jgi:hypothetical protein